MVVQSMWRFLEQAGMAGWIRIGQTSQSDGPFLGSEHWYTSQENKILLRIAQTAGATVPTAQPGAA
jgi:hypothetical protein